MRKKTGRKEQKAAVSDHFSQLYSLSTWPKDPGSELGKEYFKATLGFMRTLLKQVWIKKLISRKKTVKILDICGGAGFGGIALTKVLIGKGLNVRLLITDLRQESLDIAQEWGVRVLGKKPDISTIDARAVWRLKKKFDICLMYGLSTTHFTPWDMVRLLASVSHVLPDTGLFVVDEYDRRYSNFITLGYRWAMPVTYDPQELVVSFHTGYDVRKGTCRRAYVNFANPAAPVSTEFFFWSIAELGALMWTFFHDVDLVKLGPLRRMVVGHRPRRVLKPAGLKAPTQIKGLFNE